MTFDYDIVISGGGVAGLTAACLFGTEGFRVLCLDPAPPVTDGAAAGADQRTTAFLQPARGLLEEAGLWEALAPHAAALRSMRIVDAGGERAEARQVRDFAASEIGDLPFGWNLPNWLLRREMVARLSELPNVSFRPGTGTTALFMRHLTRGIPAAALLHRACTGPGAAGTVTAALAAATGSSRCRTSEHGKCQRRDQSDDIASVHDRCLQAAF